MAVLHFAVRKRRANSKLLRSCKEASRLFRNVGPKPSRADATLDDWLGQMFKKNRAGLWTEERRVAVGDFFTATSPRLMPLRALNLTKANASIGGTARAASRRAAQSGAMGPAGMHI
jgi:hypothetical protein